MKKKIIFGSIFTIILLFTLYYFAVYFITFSEGFRAGELVKISKKGVLFKTWEGEMSQGVSDAQIFKFSIEKNKKNVIDKLIDLQGQKVKLTYIERFRTFPWWGDTKYFVIAAEKATKSDLIDSEEDSGSEP